MHAADFETHADILRRLRDCLQQHRRLIDVGGDPHPVLEQLTALEQELADQTFVVQQRELVSWGRPTRKPRQAPPQHLVQVERFGVDGRRVAERGSRTPLSGEWNQDRHGLPRQRRT